MSDIWTAVKDSISFGNPEYLVFLPFAGVGLVLGVLAYYIKLRTRPVKTYGSSYPLIGAIRLWSFALLALTMMILAAARPYFLYGASSFKRANVDVPVVLDVSASMWVKDVRPSRLELAVRENREPVRRGYPAGRRPGSVVRVWGYHGEKGPPVAR